MGESERLGGNFRFRLSPLLERSAAASFHVPGESCAPHGVRRRRPP